ncbi:MAG: hypothetical protein IKF82_00020 [Bacilli bacterium]|nr:hypothetical protein [Bacilli bacterium]
MPKQLRKDVLNIADKIYELQEKTEHLTNGQRYAAINEIEKNIAPLRSDLHHLEHQLYDQKHDNQELQKELDIILQQISDLENIRSDLIARINTENEYTREFYHNETMTFLKEEILPLHNSISENKQEITEVKELIHNLDKKIIETEKNREIKDAEKFDHFKIVITTIVALLGGISALSLYFQPAIQTLIRILFGL